MQTWLLGLASSFNIFTIHVGACAILTPCCCCILRLCIDCVFCIVISWWTYRLFSGCRKWGCYDIHVQALCGCLWVYTCGCSVLADRSTSCISWYTSHGGIPGKSCVCPLFLQGPTSWPPSFQNVFWVVRGESYSYLSVTPSSGICGPQREHCTAWSVHSTPCSVSPVGLADWITADLRTGEFGPPRVSNGLPSSHMSDCYELSGEQVL